MLALSSLRTVSTADVVPPTPCAAKCPTHLPLRRAASRQRALVLAAMTSPGSSGAASLRLMSDLRSMRQEPPEVCRFQHTLSSARRAQRGSTTQGCSASPISEDSLFVWGATIFVRPPANNAAASVRNARLLCSESACSTALLRSPPARQCLTRTLRARTRALGRAECVPCHRLPGGPLLQRRS